MGPRGSVPVTASVAASVATCEMIVPRESRDMIQMFHNEVVGRFGVERTVQMLKAAGHTLVEANGESRSRFCVTFVSQCPLRQKLSFARP